MKTVDLAGERITLEEVLNLAASGSIRILTPDGRAFVLEEAGEFEKEVKLLGSSKKFRRFLNERSKRGRDNLS